MCETLKKEGTGLLVGPGSQDQGEERPLAVQASKGHSKEKEWVETRVVHGTGHRGEVSSSLLHGVGPWLLVPAELCAEGCVQAQENLTMNK